MLHFNWTHSYAFGQFLNWTHCYVFGQFLMLEQSHSIHHTTPISPGVLFGLIALDITGEPHLPWAQVYGLDTPSLKQPCPYLLAIIILLSSFSSNRDRISLWKALWISDTASKADAKFSVTVSINVLLRFVGIYFSYWQRFPKHASRNSYVLLLDYVWWFPFSPQEPCWNVSILPHKSSKRIKK